MGFGLDVGCGGTGVACGRSGFNVAVGDGCKVAVGMTIKIVGVIVRVAVCVNMSVGDRVAVCVNKPVGDRFVVCVNKSVGDKVGVDPGETSCCPEMITVPAAQITASVPIRARPTTRRRPRRFWVCGRAGFPAVRRVV